MIYNLPGAAPCIVEAPGLGSTCSIDTGVIMMQDGFLGNFQTPSLTAKKALNELVTFLSLLQQLRSFLRNEVTYNCASLPLSLPDLKSHEVQITCSKCCDTYSMCVHSEDEMIKFQSGGTSSCISSHL